MEHPRRHTSSSPRVIQLRVYPLHAESLAIAAPPTKSSTLIPPAEPPPAAIAPSDTQFLVLHGNPPKAGGRSSRNRADTLLRRLYCSRELPLPQLWRPHARRLLCHHRGANRLPCELVAAGSAVIERGPAVAARLKLPPQLWANVDSACDKRPLALRDCGSAAGEG
jgi:hypothetical protein